MTLMNEATNSDSVLELINTLLHPPEGVSGYSILLSYTQAHPEGELSLIIQDNWDLILIRTKGKDIVRVIVQLTLELPEMNPIRNSILRTAINLGLGEVYYRDKNSLNLYTNEYKILAGHNTRVSAILNIGNGIVVSGDVWGSIIVWDSIYPPSFRRIGAHERGIKNIHILNSNYFISWGKDDSVKIWNSRSYKLKQTIKSRNDILSVEVFNNNLIVILSELADNKVGNCVYESTKVRLRAYYLGIKLPIWQRKFQVDGYSDLKSLPDGKAFLFTSTYKGDDSHRLCPHALIFDPKTGKSDKTFTKLAKNCQGILYSDYEMPVIIQRSTDKIELIQSNGNKIAITSYLKKQFSGSRVPMLLKGYDFFFMGEENHLMVYGPAYTKKASKEFPSSEYHEVIDGKYLSTVSLLLTQRESARSDYSYKIRKLQTGEVIYSTKVDDYHEFIESTLVGHHSVLFTAAESTIKLVNLETRNSFIFTRARGCWVNPTDSAISIENSKIIVCGSSANLNVLEPKLYKINPFEQATDSIKEVLGAKHNFLFMQTSLGILEVFDTNLCEKISSLSRFRSYIRGIIHFGEEHFGAWTPEGLISWNVRTSKKITEYNMPGYKIEGVLLLRDNSLLCWGTKENYSTDSAKTRIVEVNIDTGEEKELLILYNNKNPFSNVIPFAKFNVHIGQCLELSDGRILIPPHWKLSDNEEVSHNLICLDRNNPRDIQQIPLDGYLPTYIHELPDDVLMICTGRNTLDNSIYDGRVIFRCLKTGNLIYTSPYLNSNISEVIEIGNGLVGTLDKHESVSLFKVGDSFEYLETIKFFNLIKRYPNIISRNLESKEIGNGERLSTTPIDNLNLFNKWSHLWSKYRGQISIKINESTLEIKHPDWTSYFTGRVSLKEVFLFENSIAVLTADDKLGFLRKADFDKQPIKPLHKKEK